MDVFKIRKITHIMNIIFIITDVYLKLLTSDRVANWTGRKDDHEDDEDGKKCGVIFTIPTTDQ